MSKETISAITDRVSDAMAEWQSRPLDADLRPLMMSTDLPTNNSTGMAEWRDLDLTDEERETSLHHLPVRPVGPAERGFKATS